LALFSLIDLFARKAATGEAGWTKLVPWIGTQARDPRRRFAAVAVAACMVLLVAAGLTARAVRLGPAGFMPGWIGLDLVRVALGLSSIDDYLATRREGYTLYRYIGGHDLRAVFQPFDNGAPQYAAAYNGGRDGSWILPYRTLASAGETVEDFLA